MPPPIDPCQIEFDLIDDLLAGLIRVSAEQLWPDFDPATLPLAVAIPSQRSTWLINHETADGYLVVRTDASGLLRRDGLNDRIVAHSIAMIADRLTATIIVDDPRRVAEATALAAHELFHVHQAEHYPEWGANEASQLAWPWHDAENLARSIHESSLLNAALSATADETSLAIARQALARRRDRFDHLVPEARAYESAVELAEGTARFVEHRTATLLGAQFPEEEDVNTIDVRRRCYRTGQDWCALLQRLTGPDWTARLPSGADGAMPILPDLLEAAIGPPPTKPDERWRDNLSWATAEISAERTRRQERVGLLRGVLGGSVVIRARPDAPPQVARFGLMNLTPLPDGQVLHERYLSLMLGETRITALNHSTLTTVAGDHPLFAGPARAEILIDAGLVMGPEDGTPHDVAILGIEITGPYTLRRAGPQAVELLPGTTPPDGR